MRPVYHLDIGNSGNLGMFSNPKSLIPAAGLIIWALLVQLFGLSGTPEAKGLAFVVSCLTTVVFIKACQKRPARPKRPEFPRAL